MLAASRLRSSVPHERIRSGLQLVASRSAALGRRCEPSVVQLAVSRDRPLGREGSNSSKCETPSCFPSRASLYYFAEREGFESCTRRFQEPQAVRDFAS